MKIQQATERFQTGRLDRAEIRRNPSDIRQWFVMLRQTDGKASVLVDEHERPVVNGDLEALFDTLKSIGFRETNIVF